MPIIKLPNKDEVYSIPLRITAHGLKTSREKIKTRGCFAISVRENYLEEKYIKQLGLVSFGKTLNRFNEIMPFYYIDLEFTAGLMGAATENYNFRGLMVIPSKRVSGLIIGMDLIRRGQLLVDGDGLTFCI